MINSQPSRRGSRTFLALFAATAALSGGAQALAPASTAAAVQTEGCSDEWDMVLGQCTHVTEGNGGGADNGFGQDWHTRSEPEPNTVAGNDPFKTIRQPDPLAEEQKKIERWGAERGGSGRATLDPGGDGEARAVAGLQQAPEEDKGTHSVPL